MCGRKGDSEFLFLEAICCTELKILLPHPLECWYYPSCLQLEMVALGSSGSWVWDPRKPAAGFSPSVLLLKNHRSKTDFEAHWCQYGKSRRQELRADRLGSWASTSQF